MRFIGCIPVNTGKWVEKNPVSGYNRGEEWREIYFQEATFNFGWLPLNSYGKLSIEAKNMSRESGKRGDQIEFQLAYVKEPSKIKIPDDHFNLIEGAYITENTFKPWELYETSFFKLPNYDGPVLLYLMVRAPEGSRPSVAMWTLALFMSE